MVIEYCINIQYTTSTNTINISKTAPTVSKYGIASQKTILQDIEDQKVKFLKNKYKNFSFLKIEFSQPYRKSDTARETVTKNCNYYLAFNIINKRFYKLGGFDDVEIEELLNDIERLERTNQIDWISRNEIEEINIDCLYEYRNLNKRQRRKRKFTCFESCSENIKTYHTEY